jgi:hypothetical protein
MPDETPKVIQQDGLRPWMTLVVALVGSIATVISGHYALNRDNVKKTDVPAILAESPYAQDKPELEGTARTVMERQKAMEAEIQALKKRIKILEQQIGQ